MRTPLLVALVGIVTLAGCGGDGGGGGSGGGKTVTVQAAQPLEFVADEYTFEPANVVVSAGSGGSVEISLRNDGSLAHDIRFARDDQDVGGTSIFGPDKTETAMVPFEPGDYEFICSVGDHAELGMKGKLTVR
jgi:plastocyanin